MKQQQLHETPASETAERSKKKKRHFILLVPLIAFLMVLFGQLLGLGLMQLCARPFALSGATAFLLEYLSFIGIVLLVILYCVLWEKEVWRSFLGARHGGLRGNNGRQFAFGLLLGFLMNGLCALLAWMHGDLDFSVGRFDLLYMLCALLVVCVQSGAEELVTRGYMLGALRERYPVWVAVLGNSLLFAALHLTNNGITVISFLQTLLIGLLFSLFVVFLDSLWMAIALHTAWNYTQNFLLGLPNSGHVSEKSFLHLEAAGNSAFYDATFGLEGSLSSLAVICLLIAAMLFLSWKKRQTSVKEG